MKKVILIVSVFLIGMMSLNAECDYKKQKEYNILSSQVAYKIDYVENEGTFNVTFYNLTDNLAISYQSNKYYPSNNETVVTRLAEGSQVSANVITTDASCINSNLRSIRISIPYVNTYYKSEECIGHEELNVCSSKFLDYKITKSTFYNLISKQESIQNGNKKEEEEIKKETLAEKVIELLTEIYLPIIIVLLSSVISFLIFSSIYKKAKYGL